MGGVRVFEEAETAQDDQPRIRSPPPACVNIKTRALLRRFRIGASNEHLC